MNMNKKPICKTCKGTGVYVGLGFHLIQPCDSCGGSGEEAEWPDEEKIEDDWRDDGEECAADEGPLGFISCTVEFY